MFNRLFQAHRGNSVIVYLFLGWTVCSLLRISQTAGAQELVRIKTSKDQEVSPMVKPPTLTLASSCNDVLQWLPSGDNVVILQVVNRAHLKFQQNSMVFMKRNTVLALSSLFLLCLDKYTVSVLNGMEDVRCVEVHGVTTNNKRRQIWQLRTNVLACLVGTGERDVLLSDNDALWVKDPFPDLRTVEGDILVQRGNMPEALGDPRHGVTICMGFALFRAGGEGMPAFLQETLRAMKEVGDDQVAVNTAASRLHLDWIYSEGDSDMRSYKSTRVGFGVVGDLPGNFTVSFLPHNKYTRNCEETPISSETIVVHCFHRTNRKREMMNANMWLVGNGA